MTATKAPRVRYALVLTNEVNERVAELAEEAGGSMSDLFRRALALVDVAMAAKRAGYHVAVVDDNGKVVSSIVGLESPANQISATEPPGHLRLVVSARTPEHPADRKHRLAQEAADARLHRWFERISLALGILLLVGIVGHAVYVVVAAR